METAALILSILAFVVALAALPTVLQMFFGRPNLAVHFASNHSDGALALQCHIANVPIKNRLLQWLGVKREPAYITVALHVSEVGSKRVIHKNVRPTINIEHGDAPLRALLYPSLPAIIVVVHQHAGQAEGIMYHGQNREHRTLPPGEYEVSIEIGIAEAGWLNAKGRFFLGNEPSGTYWCGDPEGVPFY